MIKLGLVSEVTNYHTLAFSRLINGADDSKPENDRTTTMKGIPIPDARIVSIYDPNPDEAKKLRPLYLDMVSDAIILHDKNDFFRQVLNRLRRRLRELGAKRIRLGKLWYWDLKPDYRFGEFIEIE